MPTDIKAKVLIVDDLPENLHALTKIIEQDDREIFSATSGESALELLLRYEFALAILDVMMPNMNGFELAQLMHSTERTRHTPIVFVTAVGRELNYSYQGYETGAVDFLYKPLDIAAVKSKVKVFVSLYQQRQEVKRKVDALEKTRHKLHLTQVELQQALEMRDDFISMVAHELRTPLNTLSLESQTRLMLLAKGEMQAFGAEQLRTMFLRDSRQIDSMNRLIGDMADVSRIQSGRLSLRSSQVNLSALLRRVVDDLAQQAQTAGCEFSLDIHAEVEGNWDEFRVEQIIVNLLTNALRYGAGRPVAVSLEQDKTEVEIKVRDHGVGICSSDQQRIFNRFERLGTKEVREGLGMGLYIARQLAEAQGGSLHVESVLGQGATFCLRLKAAASIPQSKCEGLTKDTSRAEGAS